MYVGKSESMGSAPQETKPPMEFHTVARIMKDMDWVDKKYKQGDFTAEQALDEMRKLREEGS